MARIIICQGCHATATLYDDSDPHAALVCGCCPEDHNHGVATATTGIECRPVIHSYIGEMTSPGGLIVGNVGLTNG
jgi:hypothetical protein